MSDKNNKQAFLIVTDKILKPTIDLYYKIKNATKSLGDVFLIYHANKNYNVPNKYKNINIDVFTNDILSNLKYKPIFNSICPGSNHFPILNFFLNHPEYKNYWCIENDVAFNGSWGNFFNNGSLNLEYDFISSHIRTYSTMPDWFWWKTFIVPETAFRKEDLYSCFNPIYRISNKALQYIDTCLKAGYSGHHEVVYPSLLIKADFKLADFSTEDNHLTPSLNCCTLRTMRWKPVFLFIGLKKNKLYHPVKPKITLKQYLVYIKRTFLNQKRYLT